MGASYEIPEIALRISGVYQAKQEMMHASSTVYLSTTYKLKDTKSALPASFTLDFSVWNSSGYTSVWINSPRFLE